jgi:CDP-diacylglycerol--glycerol-3-phosphate 3-phosphatidyltransferase
MFRVSSIPNLLGLFRILATPLLMWLILQGQSQTYLWAVGLLLLMGASDFVDGRLARHLKVVSPLGIFLDTISDKIFIVGALLPLVEQGILSGWIALIIIGREFIVSGLRSYAAAEGVVIAAGMWGKQKFVITLVALVWLLLAMSAQTGGITPGWQGGLIGVFISLWVVPMAMAVIWTLISGVDYLWKAWPMLRRGWAPQKTQVTASSPSEPVADR